MAAVAASIQGPWGLVTLTLGTLPADLLLRILGDLDGRELARCSITCRALRSAESGPAREHVRLHG